VAMKRILFAVIINNHPLVSDLNGFYGHFIPRSMNKANYTWRYVALFCGVTCPVIREEAFRTCPLLILAPMQTSFICLEQLALAKKSNTIWHDLSHSTGSIANTQSHATKRAPTVGITSLAYSYPALWQMACSPLL